MRIQSWIASLTLAMTIVSKRHDPSPGALRHPLPAGARALLPLPHDIPALTAFDEAGDLAGGVALENLANARIAGDEEDIRRFGIPCRRLVAVARADQRSVDD